MAKVNGSGGGARLMCDVSGACGIVEQVVEAVDLPVTVKMRLGWDAEQLTAPALAKAFERLGVAAVTVHGRTRQQGFHGCVDLDGIRQVVEAVQTMPVVGNGDVRTPEDALAMRRLTGCDAVAIGRGALLDPWIFREIAAVIANEPQAEPTHADRVKFLRNHFVKMCQQHGDYACILFRKFAAWYGQTLGIPDDLEDRLRRFESIDEFHVIVNEMKSRPGERLATLPTALIRVPNGPVDKW